MTAIILSCLLPSGPKAPRGEVGSDKPEGETEGQGDQEKPQGGGKEEAPQSLRPLTGQFRRPSIEPVEHAARKAALAE
jgi:hypothetical protein